MDFPFQLVNEKYQSPGQNLNKMELFVPMGDFDVEVLKQFCLSKKTRARFDDFYFMVLFDKAENAAFPQTPFTAAYADEELRKYIKAFYTFNSINGYSKLHVYEKNSLESIPEEFEI